MVMIASGTYLYLHIFSIHGLAHHAGVVERRLAKQASRRPIGGGLRYISMDLLTWFSIGFQIIHLAALSVDFLDDVRKVRLTRRSPARLAKWIIWKPIIRSWPLSAGPKSSRATANARKQGPISLNLRKIVDMFDENSRKLGLVCTHFRSNSYFSDRL